MTQEKLNKFQQEQRDLDESYKQSLRNKKDRQDVGQDVINTILSNEKKTDLVSTILERKRREIMIQKENEEYLREIKDKL